jgi:hypothetical protein
VHKVRVQELKVIRGLKVHLEVKELKVLIKEPKVHKVQQEILELRVHKDPTQGLKVTQDQLVIQELRGLKVRQGLQVIQVLKELKEDKVPKD